MLDNDINEASIIDDIEVNQSSIIDSYSDSKIEKVIGLDTEDNYPDDTKFKTGQVASFLGKTDQVIRNYLKDLEPLLNIETTNSGTRLWSKGNIKEFRNILSMKEQYGWTIAETADKLSKPGFIIPTNEQGEARLNELSSDVTNAVKEQVKSEMETFINLLNERDKALFEKLNDTYTKALKDSLSTLALPDNHNEDLVNQIKAYEDSNKQRIDELTKQLEEERAKNLEERAREKELNEKNQQELLNELKSMRSQLDVMNAPKKKGFFSIFGKNKETNLPAIEDNNNSV